MANPEHVEKLLQGPDAWNSWRDSNREVEADLRDASLVGANLRGANLNGAFFKAADLGGADLAYAKLDGLNLEGANLSEANLRQVGLVKARLHSASFCDAVLIGAHLRGADLTYARLRGANLTEANVSDANLSNADLRYVNLDGGDLQCSNLSHADLSWANFDGTILRDTILADTNLNNGKGLASCTHYGPSVLDHRTLARSPDLPIAFLRGCGLPDPLIEYLPSLFNHALEFYSCFISYSAKDQEFAERLHSDLQSKGIRCWFAPHDMQGGQHSAEQIDRAIQVHDRLLVILSEHSMGSNWVVREIKKARKREREESRRVLFPIGLCEFDAIREWECLDSDAGEDLAEELRKFHIPDFSKWKAHDSYKVAFERLVKDLAAEKQTGGEYFGN